MVTSPCLRSLIAYMLVTSSMLMEGKIRSPFRNISRFAFCINTLHGRRMSGPEKEHGMSEEAPAIGGITALAIDAPTRLG